MWTWTMQKCRTLIWVVCALLFSFPLSAQDDLLDLLAAQEKPVQDFATATFKSTRLLTGHSTELNAKGELQFLIGHRFGRLNAGLQDLFGIDNATIRLGFDYGLTPNINIGIGRSSHLKVVDGFFKWRILRQQKGLKNIPITATYLSNIYIGTLPWAEPNRENFFSSRLSYHHGLLLARKFSQKLSVQLAPSLVHRNLVVLAADRNTIFGLASGASVRLSGSMRLNVEHHWIMPGQIESKIGGEKVRNALGIGIDLETGGHVFQLHLTNSRGMTERFLMGETTGSWGAGDIHFGFNVSRTF